MDMTELLNWTELNSCGSRWRNCWLKISGLKIERFLWWESWRTEITVFDEVEKGARLYRNLQQGAGNLNIKRVWLIKGNQICALRNLMYGKMQASRLTEIISFICISSTGAISFLIVSSFFPLYHKGWQM